MPQPPDLLRRLLSPLLLCLPGGCSHGDAIASRTPREARRRASWEPRSRTKRGEFQNSRLKF